MRRVIIYPGRSDFEVAFGKMLMLAALEEKFIAEMQTPDDDPFDSIYSSDVLAVISALRDDETKEKLIAKSAELPYDNVILYGFDDIRCDLKYLKRPFDINVFLKIAHDFCDDVRTTTPVDEDILLEKKDDVILNAVTPSNDDMGGLVYDKAADTFRYDGNELVLTQREAELLKYLYDNRGKAVSRENAAIHVWGFDRNTNVVDVYIRYLRQKLDERFDKKIIYTVRNNGYMLK